MDAFSSTSALDYSDSPPVLIAGSSEACLMRATRSVRALGLRVGDAVPIEEAASRFERQVSASAVWVELDGALAATLARLSTGPTPPVAPPAMVAASTSVPEVSLDVIRKVIRARRLRTRFFSEELFADPAWDMLLDLLQAEIAHLRVPVSSLCIAAAVPATTALRWLKTLVKEGLFLRRADPHDGRRVFVELAPKTSEALRRYFAEVGSAAVI